MLPQTLHSLSQSLAVHLEEGIRARRPGARVPVFLCHPLDALEPREGPDAGAFGVLYPAAIVPDPRQRITGWSLEEAGEGLGQGLLRRAALWLRVRYYFLVGGGSFADQLETLGAILQALHDTPAFELAAASHAVGEGLEGALPGAGGGGPRGERLSLPLRMVEAPEGWRELGLPEHRWTVAFEVPLPLESTQVEAVPRVLRREVLVEGGLE